MEAQGTVVQAPSSSGTDSLTTSDLYWGFQLKDYHTEGTRLRTAREYEWGWVWREQRGKHRPGDVTGESSPAAHGTERSGGSFSAGRIPVVGVHPGVPMGPV